MEPYRIRKTAVTPCAGDLWDAAIWSSAETAELVNFRPEGSDHRPRVMARLLYKDNWLFGRFRVEDRYVRCAHTGFNDKVYTDSCVEFFVKPRPDRGYFNFEFNCGGAFLISYITDPARTPDGFRKFERLSAELASHIRVYPSMPPVVEPEQETPVTWQLGFAIPLFVLEHYTQEVATGPSQEWTGNFYKCGDKTSHPHWASWNPVRELNFHAPECFGTLVFE